jgi:CheY-like chemotaxis protein
MSQILVVEDHEDSATLLLTALAKAGHQVAHVIHGQDALDSLSKQPPDLIVLDLRLPTFDGIAFLKVMRSYRRWRDIPVIVVSAATEPELESASSLGVRRIFAKAHFKLSEFMTAVRDALELPPGPGMAGDVGSAAGFFGLPKDPPPDSTGPPRAK